MTTRIALEGDGGYCLDRGKTRQICEEVRVERRPPTGWDVSCLLLVFTSRRFCHCDSAQAAEESPFCPETSRLPPDNFFHLDATSSGTRESCSYSSSARRREAAATFCSRCSIEEVPGMGSIMGYRLRSQASAICVGLARRACAIRLSTSPATLPAPSGNQGIKAISLRSQ